MTFLDPFTHTHTHNTQRDIEREREREREYMRYVSGCGGRRVLYHTHTHTHTFGLSVVILDTPPESSLPTPSCIWSHVTHKTLPRESPSPLRHKLIPSPRDAPAPVCLVCIHTSSCVCVCVCVTSNEIGKIRLRWEGWVVVYLVGMIRWVDIPPP